VEEITFFFVEAGGVHGHAVVGTSAGVEDEPPALGCDGGEEETAEIHSRKGKIMSTLLKIEEVYISTRKMPCYRSAKVRLKEGGSNLQYDDYVLHYQSNRPQTSAPRPPTSQTPSQNTTHQGRHM